MVCSDLYLHKKMEKKYLCGKWEKKKNHYEIIQSLEKNLHILKIHEKSHACVFLVLLIIGCDLHCA